MKAAIKCLCCLILSLFSLHFLGAKNKETQRLWRDSQFQKRFLASYGFDGPREPSIVHEEQALLAQIQPLLEQERYNKALKLLERAQTEDSSAAIDYTIGNIHYQTEALTEAEAAYTQALDKLPNFVRAHRNLAYIHIEQNELVKAKQHIQHVISYGGADGSSFALMGYIHLEDEQYAAANQAYEKALMYHPNTLNWQLGKVRALLALGRQFETIDTLNTLIKAYPKHEDLWRLQAEAFIQINAYDKATVNLEYLRRKQMATAHDLVLLGNLYQQQNLLTLAKQAYLNALENPAPPSVITMLNAAQTLLNCGAYEQLTLLLPAIDHTLSNQFTAQEQNTLLGMQAQLALQQGKNENANRMVRQLLETEPFNGQALLILAQNEADQGHFEEAELLYQRATKAPDFTIQALIEHANMEIARQRYHQAYVLLEKAQNIEPQAHVANYMKQLKKNEHR